MSKEDCTKMNIIAYFKNIKKYGNCAQIVTIYIIIFASIIYCDKEDIIANLCSKWGLEKSIYVGIVFSATLGYFLYKLHIIRRLQSELYNEIDSVIITGIIFAVIYQPIARFVEINSESNINIAPILLILGLFLFTFRINRTGAKTKAKTSNVVDLNALKNGRIDVKEELPVLIDETAVDYDILERRRVIDELINSICACCASDRSFVIGINGEWGSGKSTIIKNVKNDLTKKSGINKPIFCEFDPWKYETEDVLLDDLFRTILKNIDLSYDLADIKVLKQYVLGAAKAWSSIVGVIGTAILEEDAENKYEILKTKIELCLLNRNKRLVVFVENLDRASSDNIVLLLKVINTVLDIRGIVFVLSYEKTRIEEILKENRDINKHYIEKIVNQEITVPIINKEVFRDIVKDTFNQLLEIYNIDKEEGKHYKNSIDFLVSFSPNLRTAKRIINSISYTLMEKNSLLYKPDLIALELIRFTNINLYNSIHDNSSMLIENRRINSEEQRKTQIDYFHNVVLKNEACFSDLLISMFPLLKKFEMEVKDVIDTSALKIENGFYNSISTEELFVVK